MDKIFTKAIKNSEFFSKTEIFHFSYFMMQNVMKKFKKLIIQRSCIPDGWKNKQSQIYKIT